MAATATVTPVELPAPGPGQPLFRIPVKIIGITGPVNSGKTILGLSLDPVPSGVLVYDFEGSSESYAFQIPELTRIDVAAELAKAYPNGYTPAAMFSWWQKHIQSQVSTGKFRTVFVDPIVDLESGLEDLIRSNPAKFGIHQNQLKMQPLVLGKVIRVWDALLKRIGGQVECFIFTVHMRQKWVGDKAVPGKFEPEGKRPLMRLAALFLELERRIVDGKQSAIPCARVLKNRLSVLAYDAAGNLKPSQVLPAFLARCTPGYIRWYIANPIGGRKLLDSELVPEQKLSEADRLAAQEQLEQTRLERELARKENLQLEQKLEESRKSQRANGQFADEDTAPNTPSSPEAAAKPPIPIPANRTLADQPASPPKRQSVLQRFNNARDESALRGMTVDSWKAIIAKRGVKSELDLTDDQREEITAALNSRLSLMEMEDQIKSQSTAKGPAHSVPTHQRQRQQKKPKG